MALLLLRVLLLGGLAAAADDASVVWWTGGRQSLPCAVPGADRLPGIIRRPLPIDGRDERRKPYFWTHDGEDVSTKRVSNDSGSLEVGRRRGAGVEGLYQCAVRTTSGVVLANPVHLKYSYLEKQFSSHPRNVTVEAGQPALFDCLISSVPEANYTWTRDNVPLPDNNRYHVIQNQLLILDASEADSGAYKCTASNVHTSKQPRVSHAGWLHVSRATSTTEPGLLPLRVQTDITAGRGARAVLPCVVQGAPMPEILWELTPPGGRTGELDITDQVLVIPHVELDQEGVYTCRIAGQDQVLRTFNLTVSEPVAITVPPGPRTTVRAGTARFTCEASGRPPPRVTWYKDGEELVMTGSRKLIKTLDKDWIELVISGVTAADAGIYQCVASNGLSSASEWAALTVPGGSAAAAGRVRCAPADATRVRVSWTHPTPERVVAYTLHVTAMSETGVSTPDQPVQQTEATLELPSALTPYGIRIRSYLNPDPQDRMRNSVSELTSTVICQGQGVPIKLQRKDESIVVTWKEFASSNPGVVEWMLQYREDEGPVSNVTLSGDTANYTLTVSDDVSYQFRVLGTRALPWPAQDLALLPWTDSQHLDNDDYTDLTITKLEAVEVTSHSVTVQWQSPAEQPEPATFIVCITPKHRSQDTCQESSERSATFTGLAAGAQYEVRAQAARGPLSAPLPVTTEQDKEQPRAPTYIRLSSTSVRVWWEGGALGAAGDTVTAGDTADTGDIGDTGDTVATGKVRVLYTTELQLPLDRWSEAEISGNSALLTGLDSAQSTYVMVTEDREQQNHRVLKIPALSEELITYKYGLRSVVVDWSGAVGGVARRAEPGGRSPAPAPAPPPAPAAAPPPAPGAARYRVYYLQSEVPPFDGWLWVDCNDTSVELVNLSFARTTYVVVTSSGAARDTYVLTVPPNPQELLILYLAAGLCCVAVCACAGWLVARAIWRRRKRARSPTRCRRRNGSNGDGDVEEGSELKDLSHVCNGAASGANTASEAGEPLLNGHVHITENPSVPKTPNGKVYKTRQYEAAFDVSRYDEPDVTLDTTLSDSTAGSGLLDTSRTPHHPPHHPRPPSQNSLQLPDDNMNSELTTSKNYRQRGDGNFQPTLQPNG